MPEPRLSLRGSDMLPMLVNKHAIYRIDYRCIYSIELSARRAVAGEGSMLPIYAVALSV